MPSRDVEARAAVSSCAGTKPMRRESIERTGRVGEFQWRFRRGSLVSRIGRTVGKRDEGSVYSTVVGVFVS